MFFILYTLKKHIVHFIKTVWLGDREASRESGPLVCAPGSVTAQLWETVGPWPGRAVSGPVRALVQEALRVGFAPGSSQGAEQSQAWRFPFADATSLCA